jgi:hypothetical protein
MIKRAKISNKSLNLVDLDTIKTLFENEDLLNLKLIDTVDVEIEPDPPIINQRLKLTPFSRKIYETLTTDEKSKFIQDIYLDDLEIDLIEKRSNDLAYNPDEKLYDYLEYYISYFFICPVCKEKSLKKYANVNMPIIDIVCINDIHPEDKTRYFQIKTTNGSYVFGEPYFSKIDRFIKVGSFNYGYNVHNITNIHYKNMSIGYICIEYKYDETLDYITITNNSFYIIPDILDTPQFIYKRRDKVLFLAEPKEISDIYNYNRIKKNLFFNAEIIRNNLGLKLRQPIFENKYKFNILNKKNQY